CTALRYRLSFVRPARWSPLFLYIAPGQTRSTYKKVNAIHFNCPEHLVIQDFGAVEMVFGTNSVFSPLADFSCSEILIIFSKFSKYRHNSTNFSSLFRYSKKKMEGYLWKPP
ncbi:MAG: hypothetical protein VB071_04510, partial [Lawsonibacter sp.]|nr:hypothetical protein [Lawsonibacter sp.]